MPLLEYFLITSVDEEIGKAVRVFLLHSQEEGEYLKRGGC